MAEPSVTSPSPVRDVTDYDLLFDCVHCGLCAEACPTYIVTRCEMDSPRGRIYLMKSLAEGRIELDDDAARHLDLCLGCRGCETACPSGVHYGLLDRRRAFIRRTPSRSRVRRSIQAPRRQRGFPVSKSPWNASRTAHTCRSPRSEARSESHHAAHDARLAGSSSAAAGAPARQRNNRLAARGCASGRRPSRMRRAGACEFGKLEQRASAREPLDIASSNSNRPHAAERSISIPVMRREREISLARTFAR